MPKNVCLIYDDKLEKATSKIPHILDRSKMVMGLIQAYDLFSKMDIVPPRLATQEELISFHSKAYIDFLKHNSNPSIMDADEGDLSTIDDGPCGTIGNDDNDVMSDYGLGYDCPMFENMMDFAKVIAGGSLTAVERLVDGKYQVAINWCGGWHHAQRAEASGFCYINDIVISIQVLQRRYKKVLYIDFDAHHGDGVENAFSYTKNVFTLSIHHFEPGYFPGTGALSDVGKGKARYFALNVPVKAGISDCTYFELFSTIFDLILEKFSAEAVVVQCGADSLAGDPLGMGNLTERGLGQCLQKIRSRELPTLIFGGGGYNHVNTAKCWTYLTALLCCSELQPEIPDHAYFTNYGPDFELHVTPTLRKDENTREYMAYLVEAIKENLRNISLITDSKSLHSHLP